MDEEYKRANLGKASEINHVPVHPVGLGMENIVSSITSLIDEETACLAANKQYDIASVNMRKSRLLYDFNLAMTAINPDKIDKNLTIKIQMMGKSLKKNIHHFNCQINAARELLEIMVSSINEFNSDKTYRHVKIK